MTGTTATGRPLTGVNPPWCGRAVGGAPDVPYSASNDDKKSFIVHEAQPEFGVEVWTSSCRRHRGRQHIGKGFRVHAGSVERILTAGNAQKAGALLERFWPQTRHLL
jgi:hypothetical protein